MKNLMRVEGVGEHPYTTRDWGKDKDKRAMMPTIRMTSCAHPLGIGVCFVGFVLLPIGYQPHRLFKGSWSWGVRLLLIGSLIMWGGSLLK
jgi:hypothetical protein